MDHQRHAPDEAIPAWLSAATVSSVVAGVVIRFVAHRGLWLDEALGVNIARLPIGRIASALRHDGHPPLSYVLLHIWMVIFGNGDVAVRALSGVLSVATLPIAWVAAKRVGGRRTGAAALIVFSWSPFLVRYASEARMYALVSLLALALWVVVTDQLVDPRRGRLIAIAVLTSALLWTHYWSIWLLVAGFGLVVAGSWRHRTLASLRATLLAAGVGVVAFVPWLPVMIDQLRSTGTPWGRTRSPFSVAGITMDALGGSFDPDRGTRLFEGQMHGLLVVVLVALAIAATVDGARRAAALAGLTLLLGAAGCALSGSAFAARYAAVAVPFLLLGAAIGLAAQRGAVLFVFVGLIVIGGVLFVRRNVVEARSQLPALAAIINHAGAPGDLVVLCPDQLGPATARELRPGFVVISYPAAGDPRFVDWRHYEARNAAANPEALGARVVGQASGHTIWLVTQGGYRTFADQCERLQATLSAARAPSVLQNAGAGRVSGEFATLIRFNPS